MYKLSYRWKIGIFSVFAVVQVLALAFWFLVWKAPDEGGIGAQWRRALGTQIAEHIGERADLRFEELASHAGELSNQLIPVPDEIRSPAPGIYQAGGVANTHLIATPRGNVVFDTGLVIQGARQRRLLLAQAPGPVTHVVLSHSHADHIGGARFWIEPGVEVVAHREFPEEQRYLSELESYLHNRNRTMFPWIPENPPRSGLLRYGGVEPSILVDNGSPYRFTVGDVEFVALATPGAEGADNLCLWLPQRKVLFSGDTLGPLFPQFPNLVTLRGEKMRKPIEYIRSLDLLLSLEPEILIPSHHGFVHGKEKIRMGLQRIRDAVQYVHDATIQGMNDGKNVYQLMREIQLPEHLALNQTHGKVSWGVRSIWEYYATWFHFDSTTELYPVPVRDVYADLSELAGAQALRERAADYLQADQPVHALHLLEVAMTRDEVSGDGLLLRLTALQRLLSNAENGLRVGYEMSWLRRRIALTEEELEAFSWQE